MKAIAYLAMLAGITGISLYAVSSSFDDMTPDAQSLAKIIQYALERE